MNFVCPKCRQALKIENSSAKCVNGHSYDKAKAGYFNLLLSASSHTHGDNREMVEARRNFLDTGAYSPLAVRVAELAVMYTKGYKVLDIGCGEGYYTDIIERKLRDVGRGSSVSAFDISRDAVRYAAKRNKSIELAVASAYDMPVKDESFDLVTNLFSPLAGEEVLRALKKNGIFIMAIPAEMHLYGLKAATYDTPYKNEVQGSELSGFQLIDDVHLSYRLNLDSNEKIKSLFMMTPYAYRTPKAARERVMSLQKLDTEVDFVIFVYRKL